ncbi:MAG: glutamate 5-kinase [Candidatus Omnitrophica bacterium]|nr:glutamate 5-kinase [Candidatus Omnitrophota bacterium]
MKHSGGKYKRVVVKIGSSLLCPQGAVLDRDLLKELADQIAQLNGAGGEVVVVSSGAIALGMDILGCAERPREVAFLQAAAALGQHELMDAWRRAFADKGVLCAQLLLTWDDFDERHRYLNAKHTLQKLLTFKSVPIINENDTVSTEEIKFGDNDKLSALVATMISADMLLILSDVDGLLEKDGVSVIPVVEAIDERVRSLVCPTAKKTCVGGMGAKLDSAKIAVDSGIPCVIANGRARGVIVESCAQPGATGTFFMPAVRSLKARKRWMAFGVKPKGVITVDSGARKALLSKKSLLAVGVTSADGAFEAGDIVRLCDSGGREFARGRVRFSRIEIDTLKGRKVQKEVVHRNDLVISGEEG